MLDSFTPSAAIVVTQSSQHQQDDPAPARYRDFPCASCKEKKASIV